MVLAACVSIACALASDPFDVNSDGVSQAEAGEFVKALRAGVANVVEFGGKPFAHRFDAIIVPHRADFDKETAKRWQMPPSEKWMVGSGAADVLILLAPSAWKAEAVEHDPNDATRLQALVTHELAHTYHGQVCPDHQFEKMDEMAWYVEGLATYVSGQYSPNEQKRVVKLVQDGLGPKTLADAWKGPTRYPVSGSIVAYIDHKYGRPVLRSLMTATSNKEALSQLGTTEEGLLEAWRHSLGR